MLKLEDRFVVAEEQAPVLSHDTLPEMKTEPGSVPAWLRREPIDQPEEIVQRFEPTWLRRSESANQHEETSPSFEPNWLQRLESADPSDNASPKFEQIASTNSPTAWERETLVNLQPRESQANPPMLSGAAPVLAAVVETNAPLSRFSYQLKKHRLVIVVGSLVGIILLAIGGWFGFSNNRLSAAPLATAPRKIVSGLPPTWTPAPTVTPTRTVTPTSTATSTQTPTKTRVPPSRTPRPPSPTLNPFIYNSVQRGCQHSGGTFIEGTVNSLVGEAVGARVTLGGSPGGNVIQTVVTGRDKSPGYYTFVIRDNGPYPGIFYVWVSDTNGKPLSDPNSGRVATNAIKNGDDPASCWQAYVDFIATR